MAARRLPPLCVPQLVTRATRRGAAARLRRGHRRLGLLVHAHEVEVVVVDRLGRGAALDRAVEEALQRVPPDRAADREADVAVDLRARAQPLLDLLGRRAAAEHDAHDVLATPARARLPGEHLAVRRLVHALDLPDVDLDAEGLDLLDRAPHQLRPQLGVVAVRVAVDLLELLVGGRHQQLEEELAVVLVEPVGELLEPSELALVHLGVGVVRVVADEHLREVRVELLDVGAEVVAVLEVELVLAGFLDRHRELDPVLLRAPRHLAAELLVHERTALARLGAPLERQLEALIDQRLRIGDAVDVLLRDLVAEPEPLLLERAAVIEGEYVELSLIAQRHSVSPFVREGHYDAARWSTLSTGPPTPLV